MKKFLAGVLTATLIFSLSISAAAAAITARTTITVDPVNIQVNGEIFVPRDVNGMEVPVFAYNGTTYAPLRALAEAYGLEVGWDGKAKMAIVTDPNAKPVTPDTTANATDYSDWSAEDEAAYQEFKGMWRVEEAARRTVKANGNLLIVYYAYLLNGESASEAEKNFEVFFENVDKDGILLRFAEEKRGEADSVVMAFFSDADDEMYNRQILNTAIWPLGDQSWGLE